MKIAIVSLRPGLQKGENPKTKIWTEDLGVSCLAAVLENLDHEVRIFDQSLGDAADGEIAENVIAFGPDLIGFTESNNTIMRMLKVAGRCRQALKNAVILLGDIIPSHYAEDFIQPSMPFDGVCLGEGEMTLLDVIDRVRLGRPIDGVPGLLAKHTGWGAFTPREKITDLSALPKARRYFLPTRTEEERKRTSAMILGSRGCIGACSFCGTHPFEMLTKGRIWRSRDPVEIVDEMESIVERFGIRSFTFVDSNWVGPPTDQNRKRVFRFCEEILRRNLKVSFLVSSRPDFFDIPGDADLLRALVEAGIRSLFIGVENGYAPTLKLFNKGNVTPDGMIECIDFLRANGVLPRIGFICFHPFATRDELLHNIDYLGRIRSDHLVRSFANKLGLYCHYPIHETIKNAGLLKPVEPRWLPQQYEMASREVGEIAGLVESIYPSFVQADGEVDRLEVRLWTSGGRERADKFQSNVAAVYKELFKDFVDLKVDRKRAQEVADRVRSLCDEADGAPHGHSGQ